MLVELFKIPLDARTPKRNLVQLDIDIIWKNRGR
jgi:hypothetical protein